MKKKTITENRMWNNTRFIDGGKEGVWSRTPLEKNDSSRIADENNYSSRIADEKYHSSRIANEEVLNSNSRKKLMFPESRYFIIPKSL